MDEKLEGLKNKKLEIDWAPIKTRGRTILYNDVDQGLIRRVNPQQVFDLLPPKTRERIELDDFAAVLLAVDALILELSARSAEKAKNEYRLRILSVKKEEDNG